MTGRGRHRDNDARVRLVQRGHRLVHPGAAPWPRWASWTRPATDWELSRRCAEHHSGGRARGARPGRRRAARHGERRRRRADPAHQRRDHVLPPSWTSLPPDGGRRSDAAQPALRRGRRRRWKRPLPQGHRRRPSWCPSPAAARPRSRWTSRVTVDVDGQASRPSTPTSRTVGEILEEEGIRVGEHDALSPSPERPGRRRRQDHPRPRPPAEDERRRPAARGLGPLGHRRRGRQAAGRADRGRVDVRAGWPGRAARRHERSRSRPSRTITLFDGGNAPRQVQTTAVTVDELLQGREPHARPRGHGRVRRATSRSPTAPRSTSPAPASRSINQTEPVAPPVEEIHRPER